MDVKLVQEIIRVAAITPVPRAPEFIKGVINLRGRIIPVVDLRRKLGLGDVDEASRRARVVVVRLRDRLIGVLVDGASQVLKVPVSVVEAAPEEVLSIEHTFIRGVAKLGEKAHHPDRAPGHPGPGAARCPRGRGLRGRVAGGEGSDARLLRWRLLLALLVLTVTAGAADVAVLKSFETPAWRPAIEALQARGRRHTMTEYDLKGDRAEAQRVLGELKPALAAGGGAWARWRPRWRARRPRSCR